MDITLDMTKEQILSSIDDTLSDVDKMLSKYRVDYLKIISKDQDNVTEYILSGINGQLNADFSWRFVLSIQECGNGKAKLNILFKNQVGKDNPISLECIPFEHSIQNFEILKEPIKVWKNNHYEYTFAISKQNEITIENYNGEIPYWEKTYIYSFPSSFPSKEISSFYKFFKHEFLNGNYIDLKENNNYAFCLMFDILENNKESIKEYLTIIAEKYPITEPYVKSELGKRGLYSKMYNGKEYFLYNIGNGYSTNIYCVKEDFWRKEQILYWLAKTGEFSLIGMMAFVNENGIIDVITDENAQLFGKEKKHCTVLPIADRLPEFIKFGIIEGDFYYTNTGWNSIKNKQSGYKGGQIEPHKITTLVGCPEIVNGTFRCEKIGLTTLNGGPMKVSGDYLAKGNSLTTLEGMALEIGGDFDISNNELTDDAWEYAVENIPSEVCGSCKKRGNKFVKYTSK